MSSIRPRRVAFLIPALDVSGAERMVVRIASGLDANRFQPTVVAFVRGTGLLEEHLTMARVPFVALSEQGHARVRLPAQFLGWLGRERPDVLMTFMFHANMVGRLARALGRVPVLVCSERIVGWESRSRIRLNRLSVRFADAITTNSQAGRRFWAERLHVPENRIDVIYNGVEIDRFTPAAYESVEPRIGVLAQLHSRNGHDWLIDALAHLHRIHPQAAWTCEFAGIGSEEEKLRALVAARGLKDRIRFVGHVDSVTFLRTLQISVHPARVSGMPNAVLESMACGLPVIATAVGGTPEIIDHERNGLLLSVGDHESLATYVERLLTNPALRRTMGTAARTRIESSFSVRATITATEQLLERVIDRRTSRPPVRT